VIMALVCLLASAALYVGRDQISLNPHRHTVSGDGGSVGSDG
jgi:hypothetical protein